MTKKSEAKLKFLKTEMVFPDEMKNIFHHSQRNFSFRNRLRPDSVSLRKIKRTNIQRSFIDISLFQSNCKQYLVRV